MYAYVGSRTTRERHARGEGISVYSMDADTGALERVQVLGNLINPSYLAINRAATRLYTVHGDDEYISAFAIEPRNGQLQPMNRQATGGRNPVHLALDGDERFVIVSNHLSSSLAVLPLADDGSLQPLSQLLPLQGEPGPHRKEQPFAKPHHNPFDPGSRFVLVPDKGVDRIFSLRFEGGHLHPVSEAVAREGAGPRHLAFHPGQPWAYAVNELDNTVTAYRLDVTSGALQPFQVLSALSDRYTGNSRAAGILAHPGGQALYVSNRGEDSLAVLQIDPGDGSLRLLHSLPTGGRTPRAFSLSPDARWLYVMNEDSDSIVQWALDASGLNPQATGRQWACGSPVCMVFGDAKED